MKAINLKTEYLKDPIGIDIVSPRLFWNCEEGVTQTAYRIKAVDDFGNSIWDSGKVVSSKMVGVPFGVKVKSKTKVIWSVKLWDENDTEGEWETASFETGILNADEWKAKWISGNYKVNKKLRYPVDSFKKNVTLNKKIAKARLYATACGLYSFSVNGNEIAMPLAPGVTDYRKRIQYQTYDVTSLLNEEENTLEAELADGWYRGSVGAWGIRNQYGTQTKFLAQLEITFTDGTTQMIVTDSSWRWSNDGKISFADNKDGEIVCGYKKPTYNGYALETKCDVVPTASNNVPIAEKETFVPTLGITKSGKKLLDFGQNFAGYISFKISAKKGQKITLVFGEMLDDNGDLTLSNIQLKMKEHITPL